jgi:signal transduction histidine kinase
VRDIASMGTRPLRWPYPGRVVDVGWAVFSIANLVAIVRFPDWETVPFHFVWVSLTIVYGFRVWRMGTTVTVLAMVMLSTGTLIALDIRSGMQPPDELTEVPLMGAMFIAMVWHARRRLASMRALERLSAQNLRMLERQREFVADASHELRTPVTVALSHAEVLAGDLGAATAGEDAKVVIEELRRLSRLGDNLLALAAAEDTDFLCRAEVDVESLVVDAGRRWMHTDRRWMLGPLDEGVIIGDADRLVLAVDALIDNAVNSTGPGDEIQLSATNRDGEVEVGVEDTGVGIAAEDLERIFERFVRLDDHPARRRAGSGLGLSIVQAIARAHGGRVLVDSAPGVGSSFRLLLPAAGSPAMGPAISDVEGESPAVAPAAALPTP